MLKILIFFGVLVLSKSQDLCGFDTDHIQGLVDRAQQFRDKYNYGIINRDGNDEKISQSFVNSCNITDCYLVFSVTNSLFKDMIYGHYKLGEDQLYDGKYYRGRGNWNHGYLEECRFEVTAEHGFNCSYFDLKKFSDLENQLILPTSYLNDTIENLVSLAGQYSEFKQKYLRDLFRAHRNAFDFLKQLSEEDRAINFKSDYYFEKDKQAMWQWNKVHEFQLFDNDREKVYVKTDRNGGQTGTYNCDVSQNQDFNITSGAVVLSGGIY